MAITTPFAQNGDKKEIPQTSSDGSLSFDIGFGSLYALPPEEGGLFIDRAQFNQLMFDTTSQVLENKQQITAQTNRINEVNTTLTQSINTKANQATTYTKTEVDNLVNAKANANATVNLTGNQTIAGIKTFRSPVVVPNATANTHAVNLAQLNTKIDSTKATKLLTENLIKTVGASGADFANLRQALEWASQYSYSGGRFTITLRCNSDMPIPGIFLPIGEALIIIDGQTTTFYCGNEYFFTSSMNSTESNG